MPEPDLDFMDDYDEEEDDEQDSFGFFGDEYDDYENYDEEEEEVLMPARRSSRSRESRRPPPKSSSSRGRGSPPPRSSRRRGSSSYSSSRRGGRGGSGRRGGRRQQSAVVPYVNRVGSQAATAFTKGLTSIKDAMPDPATVKENTFAAVAAAKERTGGLVREVKGMLSSELEQVLLKSTRPDDVPVKAKHVERLIGVTYQISGQYDLYDPILRKLWSKMSESDWRCTCKALYVLHRFSSDGAADHQPALKARLRELRRTKDPKRKDGGKYFNSRQLLSGPSTVRVVEKR